MDPGKMILVYAGTYNSLLLVRQNIGNSDESFDKKKCVLFEKDILNIKADRMPVGISSKSESPFTNINIPIQKNDLIYLTTDDYFDQFGGINYKKFLVKRFKQLLISLQGKNMDDQQSTMIKASDDWKKDQSQIEDVLVLGVRID